MNIYKVLIAGFSLLPITSYSQNSTVKINVKQNSIQISQIAANVLGNRSKSSTALKKGFPRGCEIQGFSFSGTNLVVNDHNNQAFFLMHNVSNKTVELERVVSKEEFMSPPLFAKLQASNWGAFASDIGNLNFQCFYVSKDGSERINCRDVVEVCQYPRVKFALSNMGNYWVSVNKVLRQIINDSTAKGIYLKW